MLSLTHLTHPTDTIVAIATPAGSGAIGVVRLSGNDAVAIAQKIFKSPQKKFVLTQQPSHTVHYGHIYTPNHEILDEVMLAIFLAPRTYTTQNIVEITCHGSDYILQKTVQTLIYYGARQAQAGEFTLRAYLNGRINLAQAEAVADLIHAETQAQHNIALQQLKGGFTSQIQALRQQLIHFASLIELELDFAEEDVEFAQRTELKTLLLNIQNVIIPLLHSFMLGNALKQGINTVIAGKPNAGKSTLLNALLNENRAIVSSIAGTTRDTIEEILNLQGIPFRLIDTAGIRQATNEIEKIGIEKTLEKAQTAALLLYVFDIQNTDNKQLENDLRTLTAQNENLITIALANKTDVETLPATTQNLQLFLKQKLPHVHFLPISAKNKTNLHQLTQLLTQLVSQKYTLQNQQNQTIIVNIRHYEALQNTQKSLESALQALDNALSGELLAFELKTALHYLGQISGETITNEHLLDNIFRNFCIGK